MPLEQPKVEDLTVAELKDILVKAKVEFKSSAKKAGLVKLVKQLQKPAKKQEDKQEQPEPVEVTDEIEEVEENVEVINGKKYKKIVNKDGTPGLAPYEE